MRKKQKSPGAVDLLEETIQLLRPAPAGIIAAYYAGALPFVLGFLYFWADMSASPFARKHLAVASFGISAAFLWMKCWQSVFVSRLRARMAGEVDPVFTLRRTVRLFAAQAILQPYGLLLVPMSLMIGATGWVYAFYQNALVYGNGESDVSEAARQAWKQARVWPGQNHTALTILFLFGLFVLLNTAISLLMIPGLLKTLFGVETVFTRSAWSTMNSTFWMITCGITYLCVDPITKALYVVRCFYGESIQSGADLKAELRRSVAAVLIFVIGFACAAPIALAQEAGKVENLDRTIQEEIGKREYQWRLPRQKSDTKSENGMIAEFIENFLDWTYEKIKQIIRLWLKFQKWYQDKFGRKDPDTGLPVPGFAAERLLIYALLAMVGAVLGVYLWRLWKRRGRKEEEIEAQPIAVAPDIRDENLTADQLPEDGWQAMAAELMAKGEMRLALRALYMACLAHLGNNGYLRIARYKSNREYYRELVRRAREREPLQAAFADNILLFERSWYGKHDVTPDVLTRFDDNRRQILSA